MKGPSRNHHGTDRQPIQAIGEIHGIAGAGDHHGRKWDEYPQRQNHRKLLRTKNGKYKVRSNPASSRGANSTTRPEGTETGVCNVQRAHRYCRAAASDNIHKSDHGKADRDRKRSPDEEIR